MHSAMWLPDLWPRSMDPDRQVVLPLPDGGEHIQGDRLAADWHGHDVRADRHPWVHSCGV